MRSPSSVAALAVAALMSSAAAYGNSRANEWVLTDECTLAAFSELLTQPQVQTETAAFLIEEEGGVACVIWPRMAWIRSQNFQGSIPPQTIAIVHTHPPGEGKPSFNDIREAERLLLPIFVITRSSIRVVDAGGDPPVTDVALGDWSGRVPHHAPPGCKKLRVVGRGGP